MSVHQTDVSTNEPPSTDVVIGIPAYNEEGTVEDVVRAAGDHADRVIVADDGSTDRTATRAARAGAEVIIHDNNRGYGAALQTLFEAAHDRDVDHLVVIDADGQHDPSDVPDLVATQRSSGAEIVIGSRFVGGSESHAPLYRRFGLAAINLVVGIGLRFGYSMSRVRDTQSGFRAYDAAAVELLAERADLSDGMDASVDILFQAADQSYDFVEVPVEVAYDVEEANTHNPVVHGFVLIQNVVSRVLLDRPLRLLGVPGAACLFVGVVLAGASMTRSSSVPTVPEVIVTLLILAGGGLAAAALAVERASPSSD